MQPPQPSSRTAGLGDWIAITATTAVMASLAGAISGFVWGGVGGRIAMRVVFLTSDDSVRGVTSDDGFKVGELSLLTIELLILTGVLGAIAGAMFGLLRFLIAGPQWLVATGVGLATALAAGAGIVHTGGIDFTVLGPLWLTVGLFVLIPGIWGVSVVILTDFLLESPAVSAPTPTDQIDSGLFGAIGWLILLGLMILGISDLASDISQLRE